MADQSSDPVVQGFRERISECDRELLTLVNRRLAAVDELWAYKREQGYPLFDGAREEALLATLGAANAGPLSDESVRKLFGLLLELMRRDASAAR